MLISAIQKSGSIIHIYTFFFIFFSIMVYHRILNIVPCAIQQDLVGYPTNKALYNSLHLLTPASQSFLCNPFLATTSLFSMSVSLFLFHRYVHLCHSSDFTYKWYHMVFSILGLSCTSFSVWLHLVWSSLVVCIPPCKILN